MLVDLHTHSSESDGSLSPQQLLDRAQACGVEMLSITDHDTVAAYSANMNSHSLTLVPGIELSTFWQSMGVHILGLNIDPDCDVMSTATRQQSSARLERAQRIGEKLEKLGVSDAFEHARNLSETEYVGRPHFARHLVDAGYVESIEMAFKKYLGPGKPGDVRELWADMGTVIEWIRGAGGLAVLAHPLKYRMTRTRLRQLLSDFIAAGGRGMEVISGKQLPHYTRSLGDLCNELGLLGSCGSDFHQPGTPWSELGRFTEMSPSVKPVWEAF